MESKQLPKGTTKKIKCKEFLTTWQLCTIRDGDIYVNETEHTQSQQEKDLALLDTVLG